MDFLPTKGIEYLLAITYLSLLTVVWFAVRRSLFDRTSTAQTGPRAALARWGDWFRVPDGLLFHRGHTWAMAEGDGIFRVGMDDFARNLIGQPRELLLPRAGNRVDQGERGWGVVMDDRTLGLLSPVQGQVVEVNKEVEHSPEIVSNDPYGNGWLMKVRVPHAKAVARTLLSGELAKVWMRDTAERLGKMIEQDQGGLQQDGGYPVTGFGRQLDPERFEQIVKELLLTETTDGSEGG